MAGHKELAVVVLQRDLPDHNLKEGDVGAVVGKYPTGGYEVEFVTGDGDTIAVVTLEHADIRPIADREVLHVRHVASA